MVDRYHSYNSRHKYILCRYNPFQFPHKDAYELTNMLEVSYTSKYIEIFTPLFVIASIVLKAAFIGR
jgi:hypothetical protein